MSNSIKGKKYGNVKPYAVIAAFSAFILVILQIVNQVLDFIAKTKKTDTSVNPSLATTPSLENVATYIPIVTLIAIGIFLIFVVIVTIKLVQRGQLYLGLKSGLVSFKYMLRRLSPLHYSRVICEIHQFQHTFRKNLKLAANEDKITTITYRGYINDLLKHVKKAVDDLTGADVAVHIKMFTHDKDTKKEVHVKDTHLATYTRVLSNDEKHHARYRSNEENFEHFAGTNKDIDYFKAHASEYESNGFKFNWAYHFVTGKCHFWLNNDLDTAKNNDTFFSNSSDYTNFYNSLGVFLISDNLPNEPVHDLEHRNLRGLLIIDSLEKGRFDMRLLPQIIGYFAHRIHGFLSYSEFLMEQNNENTISNDVKS
ncbi:MAG: hypothetical protein ACSHYA_07785 [Opitutaceae bacterium]